MLWSSCTEVLRGDRALLPSAGAVRIREVNPHMHALPIPPLSPFPPASSEIQAAVRAAYLRKHFACCSGGLAVGEPSSPHLLPPCWIFA